MTDTEIKDVVLRALREIAPEAATESIAPDAPLREVVDLDSVDFLNFIVALDEELGVDVPEADYAKLATLNGCVAYLAARVAA